ncbi:MAG: PIG-L family deacetylase [Thaumarchaeota archaeon]|nr:PIG-L family deacetylase [Nitrososphaerota archaeon]
MNILAIGAHPDDIELGCGGLLIKAAREGHDVFMYTLTRGGASGEPRERTEELKRSAKFIGAKDVQIDDFEDTKLTPGPELINHIESYLHVVDPDLIIMHSEKDIHHDHRAIATATIEAARASSNILSYEIPLTKEFQPEIYYDISDVIDEKVELIEIFWSQNTKLFLKANAIKGLAEYRALQSRLGPSINYVETFEVVKLCLDKQFTLMKVPRVIASEPPLKAERERLYAWNERSR